MIYYLASYQFWLRVWSRVSKKCEKVQWCEYGIRVLLSENDDQQRWRREKKSAHDYGTRKNCKKKICNNRKSTLSGTANRNETFYQSKTCLLRQVLQSKCSYRASVSKTKKIHEVWPGKGSTSHRLYHSSHLETTMCSLQTSNDALTKE